MEEEKKRILEESKRREKEHQELKQQLSSQVFSNAWNESEVDELEDKETVIQKMKEELAQKRRFIIDSVNLEFENQVFYYIAYNLNKDWNQRRRYS